MPEKEPKKQPSPFNTPLFGQPLTGVYSNVANVNLTENEVTILFLQQDQTGITPVSKVVISINHARSLTNVLKNVLEELDKRQPKI